MQLENFFVVLKKWKNGNCNSDKLVYKKGCVYKCLPLILLNLILRYKHTLLKAQDTLVNVKIKSYSPLPSAIKLTDLKFDNIELAKMYTQNLVKTLLDKGYFSASVDSFEEHADTLYAFMHLGKPFDQVYLNIANLKPEIKKSIQLPLKDSIQVSWKDWSIVTEYSCRM